MRQIYRTEKEVLIWLGPLTPQTDLAMQEIRRLGSRLMDMGLWRLKKEDMATWHTGADSKSDEYGTKAGVEAMIREDWQAICHGIDPFQWIKSGFGGQNWFKRIWCIQECGNARTATFRCGQQALDFTEFWAVATYLQIFWIQAYLLFAGQSEMDPNIDSLIDGAKTTLPVEIIGIRRTILLDGGHDLCMLLHITSVTDGLKERIGATDPRDRVYALLGVANDAAAKEVVVDYHSSLEDTYTNAAKTLLKHGHDEILSLARSKDKDAHLPSWVPDWSSSIQKPWSTWYHGRLYNASNSTSLTIKDGRSAREIVLRGVFVDNLKEAGRIWSLSVNDQFDQFDHAAAKEVLDDVAEYLSQSKVYNDAEKEEACWQIPVGDTEMNYLSPQMPRARPNSNMRIGHRITSLYAQGKLTPEDLEDGYAAWSSYCCQMQRIHDSRPFLSEHGYVGLCPAQAQPSDSIVIFLGARVPYVVRKRDDDDGWTLIGESHVYGIMDGEYMTSEPTIQDISLL